MLNELINQAEEVIDLLFKKRQPETDKPELLQMINEAKADWEIAVQHFNLCDKDMIDFAIHEYQAKERRFMALLQQAKREGLTTPPIPSMQEASYTHL